MHTYVYTSKLSIIIDMHVDLPYTVSYNYYLVNNKLVCSLYIFVMC